MYILNTYISQTVWSLEWSDIIIIYNALKISNVQSLQIYKSKHYFPTEAKNALKNTKTKIYAYPT